MTGYYAVTVTRYYCNECDQRVRNVNVRVVCKHCGNRLRRAQMSEEEKTDILRHYVDGEKMAAIAAKFGRDMQTVMRIARAAGVPRRAVGRRRNT